MLAYNRQCLDNINLQEEVTSAFRRGYITAAEKDGVEQAYPINCYTPNIAIRIGLFILTVIIVIAIYCFLLFFLRVYGNSGRVLAFVTGIGTYAVLEYVVHAKKHYQSGIDDGLLWASTGFIMVAFSPDSALLWSAAACIVSLLAVLRFADRGMSVIAVFSFMAVLYYAFHSPFPIMLMSAALYFALQYMNWKGRLRYYAGCAAAASITALLLVYCAGNYWVVSEWIDGLMWQNVSRRYSSSNGWFFWTCTAVFPLVYVCFGIRRKDALLIRTGVVLAAASILTYKNYYHLAPIEVELTLIGIFLITAAWWLIRYLQTPRGGFTSHSSQYMQQQVAINTESLVISESFTPPVTPPEDGFNFGGGTGGGGGAQGQW